MAVPARAFVVWWAAICTAGLCGCRHTQAGGGNGDQTNRTKSAAAAAREDALARAHVWHRPAISPAKVDFSRNPTGPGAFAPDADVDCDFSLEPVGGSTPKFICTVPGGDRVKVKYGEPNGELPAEVAGTRLLTALGFPTDRMYRVHSVRCRGCPLLPQQALECIERGQAADVCLHGATPHAVVTFAPAVIERPIQGTKIEAEGTHGWAWYELDRIDAKAGGSSRAEVDALRLMAVLLAHWDNKAANQKLLCPPEAQEADGRCRAPLAAIGDLGATFGPWRIDLENWSHVAVWADARACRVSMRTLPFDGATFPDVRITEGGRQLALALLGGITRQQLDALFEASGVTSFPHVLARAHQPSAWSDAFLHKVGEIQQGGPCPQR